MNFTTDYSHEYVLHQARTGYIRISFQVKGFWSSDTITLYVKRSYAFGKSGANEWSASISWGSGGRDPQEVPCDIEASQYFAETLTFVSQLARDILTKAAQLEEAFQNQREVERVQAKEIEDRMIEALQADVPITEDSFERIRDLIKKGVHVSLKKRGKDTRCIVEYLNRRPRLDGRAYSWWDLREKILYSGEFSNAYAIDTITNAVGQPCAR